MKQISRSRRRGRTPRTLVLAAAAAMLFVLAVLLRGPLAGLLWRVLAPLGAARNSVTAAIGITGDTLNSPVGLAKENAALAAELASSTAALADRNALYQENLDLKAQLGREGQASSTLAAVIERPPGLPYDTLVIDAGSSEGVKEGDAVAAGGTALIGSVIQVYPTVSRVSLFSSPGATYDALLRGSVPLEVSGQGAGSFTAQVPQGTAVGVGDDIELPGLYGGFAGTVSAITAAPGASFETLYFHLPVDPLTLRFVEVWNTK